MGDIKVVGSAYSVVSQVLTALTRGIKSIAQGTGRPVIEVASTALKELICRVTEYNALESSKLSELTVEKIEVLISQLEQIRDGLKE